jgi:hypothetical protein
MATEQGQQSLEDRVQALETAQGELHDRLREAWQQALEAAQRELRDRLREDWRRDLDQALGPLYADLQEEKGVRQMLDERITECVLAIEDRVAGIEGLLAGRSPRRAEVDALIATSRDLPKGGNVGANFVACLAEADALFVDADARPDEGQLDELTDAWRQALGALPQTASGAARAATVRKTLEIHRLLASVYERLETTAKR